MDGESQFISNKLYFVKEDDTKLITDNIFYYKDNDEYNKNNSLRLNTCICLVSFNWEQGKICI